MTNNLEIEYVDIDQLTPYCGNAKMHPRQQVEQIAKSIQEFGMNDPVAVWTNSKGELEIVEGHGRLYALDMLGMREVPIIRLDRLTDEQRRAYVHVHNQTTMSSGFDLDVLQREINDLAWFDWDAFGFGEIDGLSTEEAPEDTEFEDVEEPLDAPTRCSVGDLWKLGAHRLVCGDSTKRETIARVMAGEQADLLLTDPPYGVAYVGKTKDALTIENDADESYSGFTEFLTRAFMACTAHMRQGGAFYVWLNGARERCFLDALERAGMQERQNIIWNKSNFALSHMDYQPKHERCIYGWMPGKHYFVADRTLTNVWDDPAWNPAKASKAELVEFAERVVQYMQADVWDFKKPSRSADHPTMKPVPLFGRSIQNSTKRGDVVLDPFGGSGTALLACEQSGRRCRTIELDPHYCDVILRRWEEYTGQKAVMEDG